MSKISLNGNTLTTKCHTWEDVLQLLQRTPLDQVSILKADGVYHVARPLPYEQRNAYAHLYKAQGRDPMEIHVPRPAPVKKKAKPKGRGPKGGPDGTPPSGGTPGAGRQYKYTTTDVRAA
ncbi:hypothetical protein D3C85_1268020 [compost metagenome]